MTKNKSRSLLAVGLLLLLSATVMIQPVLGNTFGTEIQINTTTANDQKYPAIAMNPAGRFAVCWNHSSASTGEDIIAQRYNYPYTSQGSEIMVSGASGDQLYPAMDMDVSGDFLICWADYGVSKGIKARLYDSNGVAQGSEITVVSGSGNQGFPDCAMDDDGDFVIVWEDSTGYNIYAQRYDAGGVAQGSMIDVAEGVGNERYPAVSMDSSGDFVVGWQDDLATTNDIAFQRYDSSGISQGGVTTVASGAGDQGDVALAMDSSGDFVVAWEDNASGANDVRARRYNADGSAQNGVLEVASGAGIQENSEVIMDACGSFILTWEDNVGGNDDIKGRRYNSNGDALVSAFMANATTADNQSNPAIAIDDNSGSVIVWQSTGQDTSGEGIFAQRFSSLSTTWYFAEGYTGTGFEEWLTLQNPNSAAANVVITYMSKDGTTQNKPTIIKPNSRQTVNVNAAVGPDKEVSLKVQSDQPIIAERPMYFSYRNKLKGGHNTVGAPSTHTEWYFAEGYTGEGFDTWLTVQNPWATEANISVDYYFKGGETVITKYLTIPGTSRKTLDVNADVGQEKEVSIAVSSDQPIVAERPMYFIYEDRWEGGHNTMGATSTSASWYFAEGFTGSGFEEWLALQNPNPSAATATITYMFRDGTKAISKTIAIAARSRETINVNSDVGADKEVSIKVESTQPIVAERPVYFDYKECYDGGHNTIGKSMPVNQWFFAEGFTTSGFDEWLTLQNPNAADAHASITYYFRDGAAPVTRTEVISANSRETINVNVDAGIDKEVSIKVSADQPIIAERPIYFNYQDRWTGGHNTIGYGP